MTYTEPPEPFGPVYPDLGAKVAKLRAAARNDPSKRREHGLAVLAAIGAKNRADAERHTMSGFANPDARPPCASGTWHSDGKAILKAVREQWQRSLDGALAHDHAIRDRKRKSGHWNDAEEYLKAMNLKLGPAPYHQPVHILRRVA